VWLSEVGMPKYQAAVAHRTMEKRAALSAMVLARTFVPKSTILEMVKATFLLTRVMMKTPKKLKTAASRMASFGLMARVEMQVAIEFGASVQPFTRITPVARMTVMSKAGLLISY
jgi:BioD-like phosphotransacetylase family protein